LNVPAKKQKIRIFADAKAEYVSQETSATIRLISSYKIDNLLNSLNFLE